MVCGCNPTGRLYPCHDPDCFFKCSSSVKAWTNPGYYQVLKGKRAFKLEEFKEKYFITQEVIDRLLLLALKAEEQEIYQINCYKDENPNYDPEISFSFDARSTTEEHAYGFLKLLRGANEE